MTDANAAPQPPAKGPQTCAVSTGYLVTVGGLLLLIIAVLAALWINERKRRVSAQGEVVRLQDQIQRDRQSMAQMMIGAVGRQMGSESEARPFQRQDHKPVAVTLDGAKRQAYFLPASGGSRFGFQGGDVIVVEEESRDPTSTSSPAP